MNILIMLAAVVEAQSADFCADRPGLATGTCIASPGSIQIETSFVEWGIAKSRSENTREYAIGATRLRFGLGNNADVQVAFTPFARSHTSGENAENGVGDVYVGAKYRYHGDVAVQLAALAFVKLPVAKEPLGNGDVEFGLLLPMDASLTGPWSLTVTPEVDWNANEDRSGRHARLAIAGSIGFAVADDWSIALDGLFGRERDRTTRQEAVVGLSVAHQIRTNIQLDAEVDFGLTSDDPDIRLVTGFAARF